MESRDFQITARIRQILIRRAVDPSGLEIGSVDGVAHVRGPIRRLPGVPPLGSWAGRPSHFLKRLEDDLRRIDGVSSLVLDVAGYEKVGAEWIPTATSPARRTSSSSST